MVNDQNIPVIILKCFQDSKGHQTLKKLGLMYDLKGKYARFYKGIRTCLRYEL